MASVSLPPAMNDIHSRTPLDSPLEGSTSSKLLMADNSPSQPTETSPPFAFPARESTELPPPTFTMPEVSTGSSHGRRASRKALPLPDFQFNPAPTIPKPTPSPTHPVLEQMAAEIASQNRPSRPRSSRPSPSLPDFSFNPATTVSPAEPSPSPTKSTFENGPPRSAGHRRRPSEFAGGKDAQLVTPASSGTSPTKSDGPTLGPPSARKGHQHRRSQAVSQHEIDTSSIIKAYAMSKHGPASGPSTPADSNQPQFFGTPKADGGHASHSPLQGFIGHSPPASPTRRESAPGSVSRPRVGFSDDVSFIPRPLSLISSETDTSSSTIRANHSVTGSVNSFSASSPPARSRSSLSLMMEDGSPRPRPKTADAMGSSAAFHHTNDAALPKRPLSASAFPGDGFFSSSGSPPSKKKHFWSQTDVEGQSEAASKSEESISPGSLPPSFHIPDEAELTRPRTSPERRASLKKRKVRTWTGAIFSRKGKGRATKAKSNARRTPTPPLVRQLSDHAIFDEDNTIVLCSSPSPVAKRAQPLRTYSEPRSLSPSHSPDDRDVNSPVIDLDAALGPFGSEEKGVPQTGFAAARTRLHSGGMRGGADAFGNVHRRAESAPQMAPINRATFSIHHMGSNPSMSEDVFDEEEEDEFLAEEETKSRDGASSNGHDSPKCMDSPDPNAEAEILSNLGASSEVMGKDGEFKPGSVKSSQEVKDAIVAARPGPGLADSVEIVGDDGVVNSETRLSTSTLTPTFFRAPAGKRPATAPMDFAYQRPQLGYASSGEGPSASNSAISSPDADQISFNSQVRPNRNLTEPAVDGGLRCSTDDVPSLTDSTSTATGAIPRFSSSAGTRSSSDQRSASFSALNTLSNSYRSSKRNSLASLSRLIPGSSSGEKSKLRYEETAPVVDEEAKAKRKGNRMSRLMNFWRSKEKDTIKS